MTAFLYVALVMLWVSLALGLVLLWKKSEREADRRHEERKKELEAQKELFEDEDL